MYRQCTATARDPQRTALRKLRAESKHLLGTSRLAQFSLGADARAQRETNEAGRMRRAGQLRTAGRALGCCLHRRWRLGPGRLFRRGRRLCARAEAEQRREREGSHSNNASGPRKQRSVRRIGPGPRKSASGPMLAMGSAAGPGPSGAEGTGMRGAACCRSGRASYSRGSAAGRFAFGHRRWRRRRLLVRTTKGSEPSGAQVLKRPRPRAPDSWL